MSVCRVSALQGNAPDNSRSSSSAEGRYSTQGGTEQGKNNDARGDKQERIIPKGSQCPVIERIAISRGLDPTQASTTEIKAGFHLHSKGLSRLTDAPAYEKVSPHALDGLWRAEGASGMGWLRTIL